MSQEENYHEGDADMDSDSGSTLLVSDIAQEMARETGWSAADCAENILMWQESPHWIRGLTGAAHPPVRQTGMDYEVMRHIKEIFNEFVAADSSIKRFALCHVLKGRLPFFGDFSVMTNPKTNSPHTQKSFANWLCDGENPDREYIRMTKQNVGKEVKRVYFWLGSLGLKLPLPEGMRGEDACKAMQTAANRRLAAQNPKKLKS